ncbi:uncharacterized protein LOC134453228 isoform X2 [Engraulis encrasicolus]|uniref:uncharacterized protein LOC134453228 isoform X2 n=1 Tax=Engraulis encrasicolus TaxID=184585 RepID=UPI002FD29B82
MTLKYSVSSQSEMLKNGREGGKYEMQHDTGSSDSDSGNSLFITQAVTPTLPERRRRHRAASQSISSPFHIPDSENEELGQHVHHRETDAGRSRQKKTKYGRRIISFPSFQKPGEEATLSGQQRQMFVNSSIGGFFQFIEKLSKAGEASGFSSGEISQSSDLEEEKEQDGDNHQDIKVVLIRLDVVHPSWWYADITLDTVTLDASQRLAVSVKDATVTHVPRISPF